MHPLTGASIVVILLGAMTPPVSADSHEGPRHVLDTEGTLLVGTWPAAIEKLDDGDPLPDQGLPPPSKASWRFNSTECHRYVEIVVGYNSATADEPYGNEEAILRLRLIDPEGVTLGDWLVTGGHAHHAPDAPLAGNTTHHVEVHHMLGPPVQFALDVWLHHGCP